MPIERSFTFAQLVTLARAGSAWRFNDAGALAEVAANLPRVDYDPATLQPRGLLIEQAATNGLQNPRCEGAVAGSPGTVPTGWGFAGGPAGVTRTVVGVGVEDGFPFIDIRFSGTPSATAQAQVGFASPGATGPAAAIGQTWQATLRARIVGGSTANLGTPQFALIEYNGGGFIGGSTVSYPLIATALRSNQIVATRVLTGAAANNVISNWAANMTSGLAVDVTIRFAAPQLVQAGLATSDVFPPVGTPGASTRAADDLAMVDIAQWFNGAAGTFVMDWTPGQTTSPANRGLLLLDDGTANNRIRLFMQPAGTAPRLVVAAGGATVVPGTSAAAVTALARSTLRFSYGPAGYLMSVNGGAPVSVAGALPDNISRCLVGQGLPGSEFLNGWLGPRFAYYPVQYTDTAAADGLTIRTR